MRVVYVGPSGSGVDLLDGTHLTPGVPTEVPDALAHRLLSQADFAPAEPAKPPRPATPAARTAKARRAAPKEH